jgi:hypothetical protein
MIMRSLLFLTVISVDSLHAASTPNVLFMMADDLTRIPKMKEASFGAESVITWECKQTSTHSHAPNDAGENQLRFQLPPSQTSHHTQAGHTLRGSGEPH